MEGRRTPLVKPWPRTHTSDEGGRLYLQEDLIALGRAPEAAAAAVRTAPPGAQERQARGG
jgi:hypothetical protein